MGVISKNNPLTKGQKYGIIIIVNKKGTDKNETLDIDL
jgi:hypothetical protein